MQLLIFAAFAVVLSIPDTGPPWATLEAPVWAFAGVGLQLLAGLTAGWIGTRRVIKKLELEPAWLPSAQRRLAQANTAIRTVAMTGFAFTVFFTQWIAIIRNQPVIQRIWGLDEFLILLPLAMSIFFAWLMLYPADKAVRQVSLELRLWASVPARPVWGRWGYLSFMFRQHVLIVAVPMLPIVVANDMVTMYAQPIRDALFGLRWADQLVLVVIAGMVFLVAPVMLKYIWHTRLMPEGELRSRLEGLCQRVGLRYRSILIWESDGMVVNAAVMGIFRPVRYILLSDGLLEMMDDRKIEAVFGHEAGHVKRHHIQYYLLFAVVSMLVVGGVLELAMYLLQQHPEWGLELRQVQDYLQVAGMGLIITIWWLGFGAISRRFEWQADLFGARSVTPDIEECRLPCAYHGTLPLPECDEQARQRGVCVTAANTFADGLHRIAVLNGIPIEANSWRHSSISNRMKLLREAALDPTHAIELERSVRIIKVILAIGSFIGIVVAVALYLPQLSGWVFPK